MIDEFDRMNVDNWFEKLLISCPECPSCSSTQWVRSYENLHYGIISIHCERCRDYRMVNMDYMTLVILNDMIEGSNQMIDKPNVTQPQPSVRYRGYVLEHIDGKWRVSYAPLGGGKGVMWERRYKQLKVAKRAINLKLDKGKTRMR